MSRVLMDGGSGINIIFSKTLEEMFIPNSIPKNSSTTFHGIIPGKAVCPLGRISLEVVLGNESNFRKETLDFEVVDWKSQYHAILGRPAFARFMAVPHYAHLKLKMPGPHGIITINGSFVRSDRCDKEFHKLAEAFCYTLVFAAFSFSRFFSFLSLFWFSSTLLDVNLSIFLFHAQVILDPNPFANAIPVTHLSLATKISKP